MTGLGIRSAEGFVLHFILCLGLGVIMFCGCERAERRVTMEQGSRKDTSDQEEFDSEPLEPATDASATDASATDSTATDTSTKQYSLETETDSKPSIDKEPQWEGKPISLFDGKTLDGWETIEFGGEGRCVISDSVMSVDVGVALSGVCSTRDDLPKTNYEISVEARRLEGTDFFCGLTFPVAESHCTLITGGWGGALIGLSCIDDRDASSNDTSCYMRFEEKQWYKIRVRVQPDTITVWIDGEKLIDKDITGKKISLRGDTYLCEPLGMCNFMTASEFRNIQLRTFKPIEKAAAAADSKGTTSTPAKQK